MKVADYIVDFFIKKQVTDVFGYPGGMVTHLIEALHKREDEIKAHVNYNEQGSAFAACGFAQVSLKPGMAYATSGPGATNLLTGICNAYFDSIPVMFITGQVNTYESKGDLKVRQKGFQETDIVKMVKDVTKFAVQITDKKMVRYYIEKAFEISLDGRPGPVLLDIPMDIQRSEIDPELLKSFKKKRKTGDDKQAEMIIQAINRSERPCILVGAGVRQNGMRDDIRKFIEKLKIPVVTSMIAVDTLPTTSPYYFGFVGTYGSRYANFILSKCDLLLSFGTRLDTRQTGVACDFFSSDSELIRIDVDEDELSNRIIENETQVVADMKVLIPQLNKYADQCSIDYEMKFKQWLNVCTEIKKCLYRKDDLKPNILMREVSKHIPDESIIMTDVGQNQVWAAQSFTVKENQRVFFSGGHGAMGYSLPAAIGAYYAGHGEKPVFSINGDGGIQMNIQELQFISREKLPIKIIVFNNKALGMIRHFQEMYFESRFAQTVENNGYMSPDFSLIANAYGLQYFKIENSEDIHSDMFINKSPCIIEVALNEETYVFPKLAIKMPIYKQEPPIDEALYQYIMNL